MIYEIKHPEVVEHIFEGWQETLIWSCLQNIMGHLYADSQENPISAMALLGDFCFFAGKPNKELVRYKPEWCEQDFLIVVPQKNDWAEMIEELFYRCKQIPWCRDWVFQYKDYAMYQKYGLGAVILKDGEPVSGASSYSGYRDGIEIEIDTKEAYRRKGLAYICGAKLILECLERGLYPSWDAQNKWSVSLAEKLGYHFDYEYPAYEICNW